MKMLLVVFRHSLEDEILELLKSLDVKAFTEAPKVFGIGEAGAALHSFTYPGFNSMILTVLAEDQAERVMEGFKAFRDRLAQQQHGAKIPLRVFALPCEEVVG